jgi:hypothetical protein
MRDIDQFCQIGFAIVSCQPAGSIDLRFLQIQWIGHALQRLVQPFDGH